MFEEGTAFLKDVNDLKASIPDTAGADEIQIIGDRLGRLLVPLIERRDAWQKKLETALRRLSEEG